MPEPLDLAAIEAKHVPNPVPAYVDTADRAQVYFCAGCQADEVNVPWPCDAAALLARVRALEAEVAALRRTTTIWTADRDGTVLGLILRLPDGTEVKLPVP